MRPAKAELAQNRLRLRFAGPQSDGKKLGARLAPWLVLLLVLFWGGRLNAQQSSSPQGPVVDAGNVQFNHSDTIPGDYVDSALRQKRLREMKETKHKSMVADTAKLQEMVTALNAEINSTKPVVLTPDQLRKVAKIEKLARGIRETMGILAR